MIGCSYVPFAAASWVGEVAAADQWGDVSSGVAWRCCWAFALICDGLDDFPLPDVDAGLPGRLSFSIAASSWAMSVAVLLLWLLLPAVGGGRWWACSTFCRRSMALVVVVVNFSCICIRVTPSWHLALGRSENECNSQRPSLTHVLYYLPG